MKSAIVFGIVAVAIVMGSPADESYLDKYDHLDYKTIVHNDRLLSQYMTCILQDKGCTSEAKELKEKIPEALADECSKCTEKQKEATKYVMDYLVKSKRADWDLLVAKFDPDHLYRTKYEERAKLEGFPL